MAIDLLLSPDLFDAEFVRQEIEDSLAEMARRETADKIDILVGPMAPHLGGTTQLFHIVNHPTRPLYAFLLTEVLTRLSLPGPAVSARGTDHQSSPHVPMLPAIAHHCPELTDLPEGWRSEPDLTVRIPHYPPMSQRRYYELMTAQLAQHSPDAIRSALRTNPASKAFLQRLFKSNSTLPGMELWAASS